MDSAVRAVKDVSREGRKVAPLSQLTDDELEFQNKIVALFERSLGDHVQSCDQNAQLDSDVIDCLFECGLMGIEVPRALAGQGESFFKSILAIESMSRFDPSMAVFVHVHNLLVNNVIAKFGSSEQKEALLPALASQIVGAFAVTEPEAGSDLGAIGTVAEERGDGYVINGRKRWITNAREAGLFLVLARLPSRAARHAASIFLVDARAPGVSVSEPIAKMGVRASSTCEVNFDNVTVSSASMLGAPGAGLDISNYALAMGRIGIAAQMTGLAQGALERAVAYAGERKQFGDSIARFQGVSFPLARAMTEVRASRLMVYDIARKVEAGTPFFRLVTEASGAKLFASHVAETAASIAVETLGGNGYACDYGVEKFYRDAKVGKIYEGTSNILLRTIASEFMPKSVV
ncbi:acyl-CoA dehydrogenase family protein [Alkalilimnicola ehrlichii]|nr:acyl-CoA dehydrogenase family protein [Alkalilimnicola ehrlichii]